MASCQSARSLALINAPVFYINYFTFVNDCPGYERHDDDDDDKLSQYSLMRYYDIFCTLF